MAMDPDSAMDLLLEHANLAAYALGGGPDDEALKDAQRQRRDELYQALDAIVRFVGPMGFDPDDSSLVAPHER